MKAIELTEREAQIVTIAHEIQAGKASRKRPFVRRVDGARWEVLNPRNTRSALRGAIKRIQAARAESKKNPLYLDVGVAVAGYQMRTLGLTDSGSEGNADVQALSEVLEKLGARKPLRVLARL